MRVILSILLVLSSCTLVAQNERTPLIGGVITLRNEWFSDKSEQLYAFSKMQEAWAERGITKADFEDIFYNYWDYTFSYKRFKRRLSKKHPIITDLLTEENYQTYQESALLVELMYEGLIAPVWPYKISNTGGLIDEFGYYGMQDGMRIAEIGAGHGFASMVVASSFDSLDFYINELHQRKLFIMNARFDYTQSILPGNRISFVEGEPKDCAIPNDSLDVVFMRETFHHFKHRPEMLASIRQRLVPTGRLIVRERLRGFTTCGAATTRDDIVAAITTNGFTLTQEVELQPGNILLVFENNAP